MFLLDTNIISEIRKAESKRADANVMTWFSQVDLNQLYLSAISICEIKTGILAKQRRDPTQYEILNNWLVYKLLPEFFGRVLPVDTQVALVCAEFHVPDCSPINDAYIAATAKVHDMILVTRNIKDFQNGGIKLFNPFDD